MLKKRLIFGVGLILSVLTSYVQAKGYPNLSLSAQSGYGLNYGQAFIGLGGTNSAPESDRVSGAIATGLGVGNGQNILGIEFDAVLSGVTASDNGFASDGFLNIKIHKTIGSLFSISIGSEEVVRWGDAKNNDLNTYIAVSKISLLPKPLVVSAGVGGGRFIPTKNTSKSAVFGSIAYIIDPNVSLIADYTASILKAGISFVPSKDIPINMTFYIDDLGQREDTPTVSGSISYLFSF